VAQKVQTLFIDDIDGSAAEGTVRFGLDATDYEIDLNAAHAQQLRNALASYVRAGRRVGSGSRRPARGGRSGSASGLNTAEVREWAKAQGIEVKDRGGCPPKWWSSSRRRPARRCIARVARQRDGVFLACCEESIMVMRIRSSKPFFAGYRSAPACLRIELLFSRTDWGSCLWGSAVSYLVVAADASCR
jgi:hypothetical protein